MRVKHLADCVLHSIGAPANAPGPPLGRKTNPFELFFVVVVLWPCRETTPEVLRVWGRHS
ncbi:unnamed protein product [Chondrus crispus]|uniref:Uncharacterized protein n=1 Tax=Chondrus crispus TaxID=2769 RepID=R7QK14_CHOCR|nr:unnamed protein product [Chondrus crispus]CDF38862.1 unnamed protein product [Chondrus crispus]|eukprot:XP_005718767.1 unnamed protein product [Chondrus crispus]